jgi:hypothetical protein
MKPGTELHRIDCRLPATVIVFAFIVEDLVRSRLNRREITRGIPCGYVRPNRCAMSTATD